MFVVSSAVEKAKHGGVISSVVEKAKPGGVISSGVPQGTQSRNL